MSLLINCECGRIVKAETEDEIVAKVEQHVTEDHPELVGKLSRADIVAMSEEVATTSSAVRLARWPSRRATTSTPSSALRRRTSRTSYARAFAS